MIISRTPNSGEVAARVIPIDAPTRSQLWARHQLLRACLNHGRVNRAELLAILDGTGVEDLSRPAGGRSSS